MEELQAWHIAIGLVGIGLSILGWALTDISKRFQEMGTRLDARMRSMDEHSERRWADVERKMDKHEMRIHDLHIQVERRVTSLETRVADLLVNKAVATQPYEHQ